MICISVRIHNLITKKRFISADMKAHFFFQAVGFAAVLSASSEAATLVVDQGKIDSSSISGATQTVTPPTPSGTGTYISIGSTPGSSYPGRDSSIALGISGIAQSANAADKQGLAFFNVGGGSVYTNLFGFAYNYTGTTLTLYAGGFSEGWKSCVINDFSADSSLSFFFDFRAATGATKSFFYAVNGGDVQDTGMTFSSGFRFSNEYMTQIMVGNRDASGNGTWASNNTSGGNIGTIVQGDFTLHFLKGYDANLTLEEKQKLAHTLVPEPATTSLALLGVSGLLFLRRRTHA